MAERMPIPPAPERPLWRKARFWIALAALALGALAVSKIKRGGESYDRQIELVKLYTPALGVMPTSVYYDFDPPSAMEGDWNGVEGSATDRLVWTSGPSARFRFKISPLPELYRVCVRVGPFTADHNEALRRTPQGQSFELNGEFIGKWEQKERRPGLFNWCTDVDGSSLKNGDNLLVIKTQHAISPKAAGAGEDQRQLGALLDWISVFPSKFGTMTVPGVSAVNAGEVLGEKKLNAQALRLASGGSVMLPVAVPPAAQLELGLPSLFIEKGGVLTVSFKPDNGPAAWQQTLNPAVPPIRSLYQVNFYRIDLSPIERTTGNLILSYEPRRADSPEYALLVDPVILTPRHPAERGK